MLAKEGLLDPIQIVVSLTVMTLFVPCIANFFMMVKERGMKTALVYGGIHIPLCLWRGRGDELGAEDV